MATIGRACTYWQGRWYHAYITRTFEQLNLAGKPVAMVEFKTTKTSRVLNFAPKSSFYANKPVTRKRIIEEEV